MQIANGSPSYLFIIMFCSFQASSFFLPDMVPRGCHCGACIAFNVPKACQYVGKPGAGTQARLRKWVRESDRGCTGRNLNVMVGGKTKCITGCHVKKELFPSDLIDRVKEGKKDLELFWQICS